ncbi:glycosyl hydrolase family 18 protein [Prolixibacteraceae bacterium]|nr:glycosyl hydrolase family 18 protein [Prolixibacteraceae bacterium]
MYSPFQYWIKQRLDLVVFILTLSILSSCAAKKYLSNHPAPKDFKVVGYLLPKGFDAVDRMDLRRTTHVNLSFGNINGKGELVYKHDIAKLVSKLHGHQIKVFMALGGGGVHGNNATYWRTFLEKGQRAKLISNLIDYIHQNDLDGLDIDFENDFLKSLGSNYNDFITDLKRALGKKELSAAFPGGWLHTNVSDEALRTFDFINIMAYDNRGPWTSDRPGQHSPLSLLNTVSDFWIKGKGISKDRIVFGLPFYGYDFSGERVKSNIWSSIIESNPEYGYMDRVGQLWYNGIPTIARKTQKSLEMFGGVMVWSYGFDSFDDMSLIKTINQVVDAGHREGEDIRTFYADRDGDGYGEIKSPLQAYKQPRGYVKNRMDSNDKDARVH